MLQLLFSMQYGAEYIFLHIDMQTCAAQYFKIVYCIAHIITGPVYITRSPGGGTSFPLAHPVTLTCILHNGPAGNVSYNWSSSCSSNCDGDLSGTNHRELSVIVLRARDIGNYTCTITNGGVIIGESTASISGAKGTHLFLCLLEKMKQICCIIVSSGV